jgi:hypothetical protein
LRLADAVYGYNGLAFLNDLVITTGCGSANVVNLAERGKLSRHHDQPALKDVFILQSKKISGWPRLASMGAPLVVGDLICFASVKGEVILIRPDLATITDRYLRHETIWSAQLGAACHSSPIAADGHLLVGCDDGRLYAFRAK